MTVNNIDIVQQLHAEQPPARTVEGALAFLLALLQRLPVNERAGLLLKPAGENIVAHHGQMVSAGRICYPDGQLYKVLTDIPTTNGPSWQDDGTVDPSRYLAVPRDTAQEPPPPVDDRPDVLAAIGALTVKVDALQAALNELKARQPFTVLRASADVKLFGVTLLKKGQAVLRPEAE